MKKIKNKYAFALGVLVIANFLFYFVISKVYYFEMDGYLLTKGILFVNGTYLCLKLAQALFDRDEKIENTSNIETHE